MSERVLRCPQCAAPLTVSRFARSAVCRFCGATVIVDDEQAVSVERFRRAYREWNQPADGGEEILQVAGTFWRLGPLIAEGERSHVYQARRARWPTELALVKVLRDPEKAAVFERERWILRTLSASDAAGASAIQPRLPQVILGGIAESARLKGSRIQVFRWATGFLHTFDDVRKVHVGGGLPPRAAIWVWRRILEVLAFLHAADTVHGAVLPEHLLVERGEHGVRLVGFNVAGKPGTALLGITPGREAFYCGGGPTPASLSPGLDLAMSARAVAWLLGGNPSGEVPLGVVPPALAALIRTEAGRETERTPSRDPLALHGELGELAEQLYGPPTFCPIPMPD
jgi:hypothetical protein